MSDEINHPTHYTSHPSGVECIDITEHMTFNLGNVVKYLWLSGLKTFGTESERTAQLRDLKKARWYLEREIFRHLKTLDELVGQRMIVMVPEGNFFICEPTAHAHEHQKQKEAPTCQNTESSSSPKSRAKRPRKARPASYSRTTSRKATSRTSRSRSSMKQ